MSPNSSGAAEVGPPNSTSSPTNTSQEDNNQTPSFTDFVREMRDRMDRNHQDTQMFMTGFSNEFSKILEWKAVVEKNEAELREVVSVQGKRIETLEARLDQLSLASSSAEGAAPVLLQQQQLYNVNNNRHLPADYIPNYIKEEERTSLLRKCIELRHLAKPEGADKVHPRLVLCYGAPYGYSNITHPQKAFPSFLEAIRVGLSSKYGVDFNQLSMTFYEPLAVIPRHGDKEKSIVPGSLIVFLSLGSLRELGFFRSKMATELGRVGLESGSLLVMRQEDQQEYDHAIMPMTHDALSKMEDNQGLRVGLVFRSVKTKRNIKIKLIGDSNYVDPTGGSNKINFGPDKGQLGPSLPGDSLNAPHTGHLPNIEGTLDGYTDLVLGVGTNNLKLPENAANTPESVINKITGFCDAAMNKKPDLNIFIPEVLPTREPRLVPIIDRYNQILRAYAKLRPGRVTLISTSVFRDRAGLLDKRLCSQHDPIHLNREGVRLMAGRIKHELKAKYGLLVPPHLRERQNPRARR